MTDQVAVAALLVAIVAVAVSVVRGIDDLRKIRALENQVPALKEQVGALKEVSKVLAERLHISQSELTARWVQVAIQGVDLLSAWFGD